jgi:hypothetical protein
MAIKNYERAGTVAYWVLNKLWFECNFAENIMTANKVFIAVIAFVVLANAYVIMMS